MTQWGLDTLFNPAKRHMDEEKRRLQSTREEVGDNSGGKRIDLESGRVTIRKPDADGDADEAADETTAEPAGQTQDTADQADDEKPVEKSLEEPSKRETKAATREMTP